MTSGTSEAITHPHRLAAKEQPVGCPLMRASMALNLIYVSNGTAGHLSERDRAARCPTRKVPLL